MENSEFKKMTVFNIVEDLEYAPHSIVTKTISRCATGNISAMAFDAGEVLIAKISPFDTLIQILEGNAEIVIDDSHFPLVSGQSIIIPVHSHNEIKANERFKMQSVVIKRGYEDSEIQGA